MGLNKKCSLCGEIKLLSEYWKHVKAKDGLYAHCKTCHTSQSRKTREKYREKYRESSKLLAREWRKNNPELSRARNKEYALKYREKYLENARVRRLNQRKEVIETYGGKCKCCGETEYKFLALDHVENNGNKHRKEIGYKDMVAWAYKNNCPKILQLLCHNCNYGKHLNKGICPHKLLN